MFKKLLIKLGLLEDPKKAVEQFVLKYAVNPDEHVKDIGRSDDVDAEHAPRYKGQHRVDDGVVDKPREPVREVSHAHHTHAFSGLRLLLFDEQAHNSKDRQDERIQQKEWKDSFHDL